MTDDRIVLCGLLEQSADADLLRETVGFAAERLMALEVPNGRRMSRYPLPPVRWSVPIARGGGCLVESSRGNAEYGLVKVKEVLAGEAGFV